MELEKAVIAITGGAGGLGVAMAKRLGAAGARVALIDRDEGMLASAVRELDALGIDNIPYVLDIGDEAAVEATFQKISRDFGQLNGLVNNAGIVRDALLMAAEDGKVVKKMSLSDWQAVMDVNLTGSFLCGREAAGIMATGGQGGCIINIASVAAAGNRGQTNYSATKAGVIAMAVVWAKELAPYGIRSAAISPGMTKTAILDGIKPELLEVAFKVIPLQRMAVPDEIASGVEFIFRNDYFNGRVLEIDGGLRL